MKEGFYYFIMFLIVFIIFALFEAAIIVSNFISDVSAKLFWSGMNVLLCLGLPVGLFSMNKLMK